MTGLKMFWINLKYFRLFSVKGEFFLSQEKNAEKIYVQAASAYWCPLEFAMLSRPMQIQQIFVLHHI